MYQCAFARTFSINVAESEGHTSAIIDISIVV